MEVGSVGVAGRRRSARGGRGVGQLLVEVVGERLVVAASCHIQVI